MTKQTCFIIMPLTTPTSYVAQYKGDSNHFMHVLEHLFNPAITAAGLEPIEPISKGSEVIHGDIIKNLETADLVLCDMSILNPNVFFELGIRTALNKSVAMVKDDATPKIPFDTTIINHHVYDSLLAPWVLDDQVEALKTHLEDCMKNGSDNSLWSYFSMSQQAKIPEDAPEVEKQLSYLIKQVESLRLQSNHIDHSTPSIPVERIIDRIDMFLIKEGFQSHSFTFKGTLLTIRTKNDLNPIVKDWIYTLCKDNGCRVSFEATPPINIVKPVQI